MLCVSSSIFAGGEAEHVCIRVILSSPSQAYRFIFSAIYIAGIMFYKLGLEFFNGSITTLATDRFQSTNAFTKRA